MSAQHSEADSQDEFSGQSLLADSLEASVAVLKQVRMSGDSPPKTNANNPGFEVVVTILEAVENVMMVSRVKPRQMNLRLDAEAKGSAEGRRDRDNARTTLHLSPKGIFEFRMVPAGKQTDDAGLVEVRHPRRLVYATPIAYAIYGNVFEILFWSSGNCCNEIRFSVSREGDVVPKLKEYIEGQMTMTGFSVGLEFEEMASRGWFNRCRSCASDQFYERPSYFLLQWPVLTFKRGGCYGDGNQNQKLVEEKRLPSREAISAAAAGVYNADSVQESGLNLRVTLMTVVDTEPVCNLPPDALTNISFQLSKDGIFRFVTHAAAKAEEGGRGFPSMTLEYASPIVICVHDGIFEILFRNLQAVRFHLSECPDLVMSTWFKKTILEPLIPLRHPLYSYIQKMRTDMGWFNGEYHYIT